MMFRLGRLAHDPARVEAVAGHRYAGMAPPPPVLDRSAIPWVPGLYRNDVLPSCTCAALANSRRAAGWVLDGADRVTDETAVVGWFAATAGVPPTDAAMEALDGLRVLDVLETARDSGFDIGGQVPEVPLFMAIDPQDREALAHAMASLGSVYLGVDLMAEDVADGAVWDAAPRGDVVGGHAVFCWEYTGLNDDDYITIGTWGFWKRATWEWLGCRLRESFSLRWS